MRLGELECFDLLVQTTDVLRVLVELRLDELDNELRRLRAFLLPGEHPHHLRYALLLPRVLYDAKLRRQGRHLKL